MKLFILIVLIAELLYTFVVKLAAFLFSVFFIWIAALFTIELFKDIRNSRARAGRVAVSR